MSMTSDVTGSPPSRLPAAREFFSQLRKGAKTIAMYRHNSARFAEFLGPAYQALSSALEPGPMVVRIFAEEFQVEDEPVWQSDGAENVPFRFYREGVRQLVLRPGVTEEELGKLVLAMMTASERTGEEIVPQLWAASFEHVEYVVVEGFKVGELSDDQVTVEVGKIVDYLTARLRGSGDDTIAFARINAADLELKLEGVEQIRGALFDGDAVSPTFQQKLQKELERDEGEKQSARLVSLIEAQLRDAAFPSAASVAELLTSFVDGALIHEDLAVIVRALDVLERTIAAKTTGSAMATEVKALLSERLGDEGRVRRLGEIIKHKPQLEVGQVARYLGVLAPETVGTLLDVLDSLDVGPTRGPFIDALARLVPERPAMLEARLGAANTQTVRDLVAIVVRGTFPDANRYLQAALRNPNPQVRLAVVQELGNAPRPELAHRFVLEATTDKTPSVRAAGFRALAQVAPKRAAVDLMRLPKLPDWDKREPAERELIHVCLGLTHQPEALVYFQKLLAEKKSLLNARKVLEGKLHAIAGLQSMASLPAFKLLQGFTQLTGEDEAVLTAGRKAMFAVKKQLFDNGEGRQRPTTSAGQAAADAGPTAEALFDEFKQVQDAAAQAAAEEKARIDAAIKAREAAEAAEAARKAKEREEQMQRPFGFDPAQVAALQAAVQPAPLPPRPTTGSRPPPPPGGVREESTKVIAPRFDTAPKIPAAGAAPPPPPPPGRSETSPGAPPAARHMDTSPGAPRPPAAPPVEDDMEFHIDIEGDA